MPWKKLQSWFESLRRGQNEPPMPLTLITLRGVAGTSEDEVEFYRHAEFDALVDWARNGRFVMAFVARDRDELTLLCTESVGAMEVHVGELPLVAAGLAEADIRTVSMLRLAGSPSSLH